MDDVEFVEEDSYVYEDSVSSWGLDRIDQDDLPLDDSFSPPGRPMGSMQCSWQCCRPRYRSPLGHSGLWS